jgi:hypothetical protein
MLLKILLQKYTLTRAGPTTRNVRISEMSHHPRDRSKRTVESLPPLRRFDFNLVRARLDGLLFNVNRTLERRAKQAARIHDYDSEREYVLLMALIRIASNSYNALRYLLAEKPKDPNRKPTFVLIIPPVNRQLMDLLFTLVYILDDLRPRAIAFQRATWRELTDEFQRYRTTYKNDPEWRLYFEAAENASKVSIPLLKLTEDQQRNPSTIRYWKHPGELKDEPTSSRKFLRWLYKWLYIDTSAQAHLSAGGLFVLAPFLLMDILEGSAEPLSAEELSKRREYRSYHFLHFSRTIFTVLAIATELDARLQLGYQEAVTYLWTIIREHVPEGREMYERRYSALLGS